MWVALAIIPPLAVSWYWQPTGISDFYFAKQDLPVLCAMAVAAAAIAHLKLTGRWRNEIGLPPRLAWAGLALLFAATVAGHWLVMLGYDLSRDQAMATFAARQVAEGALVTPVPEEWRPFGRAMHPLYYNGQISPRLAWTSGYLPVNSAFQALGGLIAHRAIANPALLVVGLLALWNVARRIWPERRDAAVIAVVLGATSVQLIANAMTSFAMIGHFSLNMVWLALFLRNDKVGIAGALAVGFLAVGLHQLHFHPMFAAPFLAWLVLRRQWPSAALFALGYAAILLFWREIYPQWLIDQAGTTALERPPAPLDRYVVHRAARLLEYSWTVWPFNLARFVAWQNVALIPLVLAALPALWRPPEKAGGPLLPIAGACAIGLVFMVFQGQGFGYRYLSGLIGCFCLLAGYGWVRWVRRPGPGRAWALFKAACAFTLLFSLPLQLAMSRSMVAPYARVHQAARESRADVVLVDTEGSFLAQDVVQNDPDFARGPKLMDLRLVPATGLATLCRTQRVARIDRTHFRAAGVRPGGLPAAAREALADRRAILDRLGCAPPVAPIA
jgi:hypothetical protein